MSPDLVEMTESNIDNEKTFTPLNDLIKRYANGISGPLNSFTQNLSSFKDKKVSTN